ncbi:MAG: TIGR04190 family B12-binding domain/radical SAM domain protein [Gammaproteobacteria bacterium]|nr:TIGR04190 family B12-binding domain/radical SAM domain protein [Gammaproteobacteria bacterium]
MWSKTTILDRLPWRSDADVVFLHPPSLLDFRSRAILLGPISDVIPSSPIFEMYPIGFLSLSDHLERAGFSTRIINLAAKMLASSRYDPERTISKLRPKAFAVDLHWLPHVQGSLAIGELIKKHHPDIPVIYGGYSATYFADELIRYPFVDYVVKGDSTERPLVLLMQAIEGNGALNKVPNLTYKDGNGQVRANKISHVPTNIDDVATDYIIPIRKSLRFFDIKAYLPFRSWAKYPITAVFPFRGCGYNCATCGGSRFACGQVYNRHGVAARSPGKVSQELRHLAKTFNAPTMIIGDIMQNGRQYAYRILDEIKRIRFRNELVLEFFTPPSADIIERVRASVPRYNVEISPESHDERVRRAFGRPFSNNQLEKSIQTCIEQGCERIDLFFMIGLPEQDYQSVMDTIDYCEYLLLSYGQNKTLHPFIAPLAPFIDPGSAVWEQAEAHGYRLFARSLCEHRELMDSASSWKQFLNYETAWMSRDEIVDSTYEAALRLNTLKRKYGLISQDKAAIVDKNARTSREQLKRIDALIANRQQGSTAWKQLEDELKTMMTDTICYKEEINWPTSFYRFNIAGIISQLLGRT